MRYAPKCGSPASALRGTQRCFEKLRLRPAGVNKRCCVRGGGPLGGAQGGGADGELPEDQEQSVASRTQNLSVFTALSCDQTAGSDVVRRYRLCPHRRAVGECVSLREFEIGGQARQALGAWFRFFNGQRSHTAFDGRRPMDVYREGHSASKASDAPTGRELCQAANLSKQIGPVREAFGAEVQAPARLAAR